MQILTCACDDVQLVDFPHIGDEESWVNVYQSPSPVPFTIARVFNVYAKAPCHRGKHAHQQCTQLIVCVSGAVRLNIKDGTRTRTIDLNTGAKGALVPPGLWVEVEYCEANSAIMVLCDLPYDETEYVRLWDDFLQIKGI